MAIKSQGKTAIILVGGPSRGTGFRPLSLQRPKPLFPIGGKPMIYHLILALSRIEKLEEIFLIGFYEETVFRDFLHEMAKEFPQMKIKYLREYQSLGTAGGMYLFRDAILKSSPSHLIVMYADICCSFPISQMIELHDQRDAIGTLLGTRVGADTACNFGCIAAKEDNTIIHYVEKPSSYISNLISCGVFIFNPQKLFRFMQERQSSPGHRRRNSSIDFRNKPNFLAVQSGGGGDAACSYDTEHDDSYLRLEQDVIGPLADSSTEGTLVVYETKDFWRQIKTAGSAVPANQLYLQASLEKHSLPNVFDTSVPTILGPVFIDPTATVHHKAILGPNVSIGPGVKIGKGCRIKNAIILDGTEVKDHACILHSIIDENCKIGEWCRLEGTPTLPTQHNMKVLRNGVKVQAISVFAADTKVAPEVCIQNCIVLPHKEIRRDIVGEVIM